MAGDFVHPALGDEVRAIGGGYALLEEHSLSLGGHELLYLLGAAQLDTSCCGAGGCGFALVAGFVVAYHARHDASGRPVSVVEPVTDESMRRQLAAHLMQETRVQEVQFWSPKEETR